MAKTQLVVVAALLLVHMADEAAAAEISGYMQKESTYAQGEKSSKKMEKIRKFLNAAGLNDPLIMEWARTVDGRLDHGYLLLQEVQVPGGNLSLRYHLQSGADGRAVQLRFVHEDLPVEAVAQPGLVMVQYRTSF